MCCEKGSAVVDLVWLLWSEAGVAVLVRACPLAGLFAAFPWPLWSSAGRLGLLGEKGAQKKKPKP